MFKVSRFVIVLSVALCLISDECLSRTIPPKIWVESFIRRVAKAPMGKIIARRGSRIAGYDLLNAILYGGLTFYVRNMRKNIDPGNVADWFVPGSQEVIKVDAFYDVGFWGTETYPYEGENAIVETVYERMANDVQEIVEMGRKSSQGAADLLNFSRVFNAIVSLGCWSFLRDVGSPVPTTLNRLAVLEGFLKDVRKMLDQLNALTDDGMSKALVDLSYAIKLGPSQEPNVSHALQNVAAAFVKLDALVQNEYTELPKPRQKDEEQLFENLIKAILGLKIFMGGVEKSNGRHIPFIDYVERISSSPSWVPKDLYLSIHKPATQTFLLTGF